MDEQRSFRVGFGTMLVGVGLGRIAGNTTAIVLAVLGLTFLLLDVGLQFFRARAITEDTPASPPPNTEIVRGPRLGLRSAFIKRYGPTAIIIAGVTALVLLGRYTESAFSPEFSSEFGAGPPGVGTAENATTPTPEPVAPPQYPSLSVTIPQHEGEYYVTVTNHGAPGIVRGEVMHYSPDGSGPIHGRPLRVMWEAGTDAVRLQQGENRRIHIASRDEDLVPDAECRPPCEDTECPPPCIRTGELVVRYYENGSEEVRIPYKIFGNEDWNIYFVLRLFTDPADPQPGVSPYSTEYRIWLNGERMDLQRVL